MTRCAGFTLLLLLLVALPVAGQTGDLSLTQGTARTTVTQTAHGFTAGQWVMFNATTDAWQLLDISSSATMASVNLVGYVLTVQTANSFTVVTEGRVRSVAHGLTLGPLYGSTSGAVTPTVPALGTIEWLVCVAIDADTFIVQQKEWIQL